MTVSLSREITVDSRCSSWLLMAVPLLACLLPVQAQKLIHYIPGEDSAPFIEDATGLKMTDSGQLLISSSRKGTLLLLEDGKFRQIKITPEIFKDSDLAGIDQLADGRLVIANSDSNQIAVVDATAEQLISRFSKGGNDAGEIDNARGLAVSVNNKIYVADRDNNRISVFNHQGLFLKTFGQHAGDSRNLSKPTHIAVDADENVYVLEAGERNRISIFQANGLLIQQLDGKQLGDLFGSKIDFSAMTVDLNGMLYLADDNSRKIFIYDRENNKILSQFGSLGQSRGQYRSIVQMSVNNQGQLAVLDNENEKVEIYQLEQRDFRPPVKRDVVSFAGTTQSDCRVVSAFVNDQTLCIKKDGKGIVRLNAEGKELGGFASEVSNPTTLHSGPEMVAILQKNMLHTYTHSGQKIYSVGRYGSLAGAFDGPEYVFTAHNRVYVGDTGNQRVQIFAADGQFVAEVKASADTFGKLGPIAVDSLQQLYVADREGRNSIKVLDSRFNLIATLGDDDGFSFRAKKIHALDIDRQDRLFALVSSDQTRYSLRIYDRFEQIEEFGSGDSNGSELYFETVGSISVSSTDKLSLLVNDSELKKLFRFDYLEYPDAAYGLRIEADKSRIQLQWSSSHSPMIAGYDIQASASVDGPFETLLRSRELNHSLTQDEALGLSWFRVVSVSGFGLVAKPSTPKENLFYRLQQLHKAARFSEVIALSERLLANSPDAADVLELKADSQLQSGQLAAALNSYRQLERFPQYQNLAISQQIQVFFRLEEYLEAKSLIERVLAQKPEHVEPYLTCTELSLLLSDAIGAVTCAEDGLARHADHIKLRYLLGKGYILAGIEDQGLEAFRSVLTRDPNNHAMRLQIAGDLLDMQQFEQALAHFDMVMVALPSSTPAAIGKANALLKLNRDDEAKALSIKLSGHEESKGDGYYVLGKIALKQEKYTEAVLRLTRASKLKPDNIDSWLSLAKAYVELNKRPQAIDSLNQGIATNAQAFALYQLAGEIELDQEHYNEANVFLEQAVGLNAQSLIANRLYAKSLYSTRNYRSAAIFAERSARIAPKNIDVLTLQADIANQSGKVGSAIEFLKTAISLQPASAELQYQLGKVYLNANLFDASTEHLEKAASINPAWDEPVVGLGLLYSKRRLFDQSIVFLERAVALNPSDNNRAMLNSAFADKKKSLEFNNNAPQLQLSDLNLKHVFSAAYKQYANQSLGSVSLSNVSATDYGNLELSFQIREYMDFPSVQKIELIKGNESQRHDFKVTFNNRILEVDEDIGVQVEVKLSFQRDGKDDSIRLIQPMTIYGKNAMVWGEPNMVGSFVTPKDDTLRDYVRRVINSYQPDIGPLNDKLVSAMTYFSSLTAAGSKYVVDPNTPYTSLRDDQVDYVQFPRETLKLKSGDCDDLSVLLSAGLENLGIETAFIEVPGHLFMMFNTGLSVQEASLISRDRSLLVMRNERIWVPLEATMVGSSFSEAWAEGARKYHAAMAENILSVIDLRQAWQHYQPVTLAKSSFNIEEPDKEQTLALVKTAQTQLLSKSIDRLILPYQSMLENNQANINARMQIAILYSRYGLYDDAQQVFDVLHELAAENSAVHSNQGNLYLLMGDYDRAIASYQQAAKLDDRDGGIWINLSMASYRKGDLKAAASDYQQAIQLSPELAERYSAYSKLLSQ